MPESRSIHDTGMETPVPDEAEFGIGLLFSAPDDFQPFRRIMEGLKAAQVPYDYYATAMYRDPGGVQQWTQFAEWRRLRVIIAAAGSEPVLPWMAAEASLLPVIGLPLTVGEGAGRLRSPDLPVHPPRVPVLMAPRDDWQMALQMALRILALCNPHARAIVAAVHDNRSEELAQEINRMFAEHHDLLRKAKTPESSPASAGSESKPDEPPVTPPHLSEPQAPPEAEPITPAIEMESMDESGDIEADFAAYQKIFRQEISKIRIEVQQMRNPDQKKFEDEARRAKQAAAAQSSARDKAPLRALQQYAGPLEGLVPVDPEQPQLEVIEAASAALHEGAVIAIPTDTVYGLAVDATNTSAIERLYELKGREETKAIPLLIHSLRMLEGICPALPDDARKLAKAFWPGPLTLVVSRHTGAFDAVTQDATIGVRLPDNFVALSVISMFGRPLAVTSANPSGAEPAASGEQVAKYFGGKVRMILDAGPAPGGPVSTVLRVVEEPFEILREGKILREQLERVMRGKMK